MANTLLVRHAERLVTMDAGRREIADGAVFARDGVIEAVGPSDALPATADTVIDARDHVVMPGLVNTHHHMYQTLTRARCRTPRCSRGCRACTRCGRG
jgi:cytosine/adenosine deaminase-related metal-dependent hydrolase